MAQWRDRSRNVSDSYRANANDRGYGHEWRRQAARYLAAHPWCLGCLAIGVRRKAELVDHVIPHKGNGKLFWESSNWQPLCKWHHNSVKMELERLFYMKRITPADLRVSSGFAIALTRLRYRPAIGPDGFPIAGS